MLFRPKDRKYTAKEVQKKADGYAMAYIKSFKKAIEQSFDTFKTSVTNTINSFTETIKKYFDPENGEFYKRSKDLDEKYNNFTADVDGKIENKADKATTLDGYGITNAYTKDEVNALSEQNSDNINATLNMYYYDKDNADSRFAKKEDLSEVTGKVESVNGQKGNVNLNLEDISDNITADESGFTYSGSGANFQMNLSGFRFSTTSYNGLSLNHNGLIYSGSPFTDDDIILNQISWVDENDQSQGVATATHKLSRKAELDLSNVSNEDFLAKLNDVLPDGDEVSY